MVYCCSVQREGAQGQASDARIRLRGGHKRPRKTWRTSLTGASLDRAINSHLPVKSRAEFNHFGRALLYGSIRRCMAVLVWCATNEAPTTTQKHWHPLRCAPLHKLHNFPARSGPQRDKRDARFSHHGSQPAVPEHGAYP